jgi:hypothetical protein
MPECRCAFVLWNSASGRGRGLADLGRSESLTLLTLERLVGSVTAFNTLVLDVSGRTLVKMNAARVLNAPLSRFSRASPAFDGRAVLLSCCDLSTNASSHNNHQLPTAYFCNISSNASTPSKHRLESSYVCNLPPTLLQTNTASSSIAGNDKSRDSHTTTLASKPRHLLYAQPHRTRCSQSNLRHIPTHLDKMSHFSPTREPFSYALVAHMGNGGEVSHHDHSVS